MSPGKKNAVLAIALGAVAVGIYIAFFFEMAAR